MTDIQAALQSHPTTIGQLRAVQGQISRAFAVEGDDA